MKKLFMILLAWVIAVISYAGNPEANAVANASNVPAVSEELTLKGQFCTGEAGYFGPWKTLYLNGNRVGANEEALIQLDLDGAELTQWEFNPLGGNGTVYVSELNLRNGIIRFRPLSGSVVTFAYTLEKNGVVKVGSCSFLVVR